MLLKAKLLREIKYRNDQVRFIARQAVYRHGNDHVRFIARQTVYMYEKHII